MVWFFWLKTFVPVVVVVEFNDVKEWFGLKHDDSFSFGLDNGTLPPPPPTTTTGILLKLNEQQYSTIEQEQEQHGDDDGELKVEDDDDEELDKRRFGCLQQQ